MTMGGGRGGWNAGPYIYIYVCMYVCISSVLEAFPCFPLLSVPIPYMKQSRYHFFGQNIWSIFVSFSSIKAKVEVGFFDKDCLAMRKSDERLYMIANKCN